MSRTLKITERCRAVWLCLTRRQRECRSLFHQSFTTRSQRQASSKIPSKPRRRMPARLKGETQTLKKLGLKRCLLLLDKLWPPTRPLSLVQFLSKECRMVWIVSCQQSQLYDSSSKCPFTTRFPHLCEVRIDVDLNVMGCPSSTTIYKGTIHCVTRN